MPRFFYFYYLMTQIFVVSRMTLCLQLSRKSFFRTLLPLCVNTMRRSNNRDCSHCLRGSDTSTLGGSCVDFLQHEHQSVLCHGGERGTGNVRACYLHQPPFPAKHSNIYSICTNRSPLMAVGWTENRRAAISGKWRMFQLCAEADRLSSFLPVSCQLLTCFEHFKTTDKVTRKY